VVGDAVTTAVKPAKKAAGTKVTKKR